ncbi:MAG: hypothetical protein J6I85_03405 [Clostridia bacterium]|nr:hypothetical protein [Clostridia bacterium]MBR0351433.1 hypothetical protein [Clostridia bacterium]
MKRFIIRDREAGNIIDSFDTFNEAEKKLKSYEEEDKKENIYSENFYEIYDSKLDKAVDECDYIRNVNMIFSKNGNGFVTTKITIPVPWAKELGFTEDNKTAKLTLEDKKIIIEKIEVRNESK